MTELLNRHRERDAVASVLAGARAGAGGALVLRGESGTGKTALLDHAAQSADDMTVVRLAGVESEVGLGFAALHRLLIPLLPRLTDLPPPQQDAVRAAFGQTALDIADGFLVGLAVLALLADAAGDRALLIAVDDAQWLDEATTDVLAFVARRLGAARIALVAAVLEPTVRCRSLDGLPDLYLAGLPDRCARELLARIVDGPMDERVVERIVAETGGNPLALVEFGRELTGDPGLSGTPPPHPLPISDRLKERLLRWVRILPAGTRTLLLLAAAEPSGSQALVRRAAERLGLGPDLAAPAEAAGLLTSAEPVVFRHPLIRSAVYHGAPRRDRRRVHAALAAVADRQADADGRAWHLAAAASEPDERVASELAHSAGQAGGRGDRATEATLLTRAADLTPDAGRRAERLLDGASAELAAGSAERAQALLDRADPSLTGRPARARARQLRGNLYVVLGRFGEAPSALLHAAQELAPVAPERARHTLLDALHAALMAGHLVDARTLLDVVQAAQVCETASHAPPSVVDLLLEGFTTRLSAGYRAAAPLLRQAVTDLLALESAPEWSASVLPMGCWAAAELVDAEAHRTLADRWTGAIHDRYPGHPLPVAPSLPSAGTGPGGTDLDDLLTLAWRGREPEARAAATERMRDWTGRGFGAGVTLAHYALTILELGMGQYEAALTSALHVYHDDPPELGTHVLPEVVEAAIRSGNRDAAESALERFRERALASGTVLARGLLTRCLALLADDGEAESLYREALDDLQQSSTPVHRARTHLVYGEWLRRQRRRRDAREHLRAARDLFEERGMEAFAGRAQVELQATGERASKRTGIATDELTPQEAQVARLVAEGSSNREVAAQLYISPNTVEYHLQKVFRKVGVSSRTQLAHAMLDRTQDGSATAARRHVIAVSHAGRPPVPLPRAS